MTSTLGDTARNDEYGPLDFLKLSQTFMASSDTNQGQSMLLSTFVNPYLTNSGIRRVIDVQNPGIAIVDTLKKYARRMKSLEEWDEESDDEIPMNAMLVLGDVARKLEDGQIAQRIIDFMFEKMDELRRRSSGVLSPNDVLFFLNSFGNAGDRAPLDFISMFLKERHAKVDDKLRIAAIDALRRRISEKDDKKVRVLLHKVIDHPNLDESLKIAAIRTQLEREKFLRNAASFRKFSKLLLNSQDEISKPMKASLLEYLTTASREVEDFMDQALSEADMDTILSDAEIFKKIAKGVKKAAQAVGNGVKKAATAVANGVKTVGNVIVNGAKKVEEAFQNIKKQFSGATFSGTKVCLPASNKANDKICFHDQEMLQYVQSQGDLSQMRHVAHFEFERLVGSNLLHLYIGGFGYSGTNFNCKSPPKEFQFLLTGRANIRASVFNRKFDILNAHFLARQTGGTYKDRIFLKLLGTTIVDQPVIPPRVNLCTTNDKNLAKRDFPSLPSYSITIMLGPIPVSLGFKLTANTGIDQRTGYCTSDLSARTGVVPSVSVGVSGHAALSIIIAKAGLEVSANFNYGIFPNVNVAGVQCRICANLDSTVKPMTVRVSAFADVNLLIFKAGKSFKLFEWSAPANTSPLYQLCKPFTK